MLTLETNTDGSHNHTIYIGVKHKEWYEQVVSGFLGNNHNVKVLVGEDIESFSKLVNTCIQDCPNDIMIFCSHRVRPTQQDIGRLLELINKGFGYVGLYRFAFFGIHKKVISRIGYLDERFIWGGAEDDDFKIRLDNADIGYYEDHSVTYFQSKSTAPCAVKAIKHWGDKYSIDPKSKTITCHIADDVPSDITYSTDLQFKTKKDTQPVKNIATRYSTANLQEYRCIDETRLVG